MIQGSSSSDDQALQRKLYKEVLIDVSFKTGPPLAPFYVLHIVRLFSICLFTNVPVNIFVFSRSTVWKA